jgi:nitroimidazol reductase NimA-like FMN-containing flavoprotein (pyridoxamine 5'-phosphate oxidase superfamily)
MKADRDDSEVFSREECLALLASMPIGRVVYTDQALPAVRPVTFILDGDEVTVHTGSDAALAAALHDAVVAFQVDDFDPVTMTGWSVTVTGQARLSDTPEEVERVAAPAPRLWAHAPNGAYFRISARRISGIRMGAASRVEGMNEPMAEEQAC